jgi:hypothetical protein
VDSEFEFSSRYAGSNTKHEKEHQENVDAQVCTPSNVGTSGKHLYMSSPNHTQELRRAAQQE